jgi:LuxR family maltose regulon positive regulatory protein
VLTARTEPELPLAILRVRDELVEISAADMRFNEAETEAFLQTVMQADFPASAVRKLAQKTEGWPAGLRLVTLSLHNRNGAEIERLIDSFSGSDRYIADYLIKEVFDSQSEDIQSFLLRTCFLTRMTGSLCDAVTETQHSADTLARLERDNLFLVQLERGGDQVWYRYSPLFAESLQGIARQRLGREAVRISSKGL